MRGRGMQERGEWRWRRLIVCFCVLTLASVVTRPGGSSAVLLGTVACSGVLGVSVADVVSAVDCGVPSGWLSEVAGSVVACSGGV
jgi:hypothetical protein